MHAPVLQVLQGVIGSNELQDDLQQKLLGILLLQQTFLLIPDQKLLLNFPLSKPIHQLLDIIQQLDILVLEPLQHPLLPDLALQLPGALGSIEHQLEHSRKSRQYS